VTTIAVSFNNKSKCVVFHFLNEKVAIHLLHSLLIFTRLAFPLCLGKWTSNMYGPHAPCRLLRDAAATTNTVVWLWNPAFDEHTISPWGRLHED